MSGARSALRSSADYEIHRPQGDAYCNAVVHGHRYLPDRIVPTYETVGIWGAVILTVLRMIQGIGVGGEWGGTVLLAMEWSRHHGLVASWPQSACRASLVLANLAVLGFSELPAISSRHLGLAHSFGAVDPSGRRRL